METGCLSMGSDAQCQDENILDQGGPKSHDKCPPKRQKRRHTDTERQPRGDGGGDGRDVFTIQGKSKLASRHQTRRGHGEWGMGQMPLQSLQQETLLLTPGCQASGHQNTRKQTFFSHPLHGLVLSEGGLKMLICLDTNTSMLY